MKIELELWHLITLFMAFVGCLGFMLKIAIDYLNRRDNERQIALQTTLSELSKSIKSNDDHLTRLERELLIFKADVAKDYVRREDYVQMTATFMAKVDSLSLKIDTALMREHK